MNLPFLQWCSRRLDFLGKGDDGVRHHKTGSHCGGCVYECQLLSSICSAEMEIRRVFPKDVRYSSLGCCSCRSLRERTSHLRPAEMDDRRRQFAEETIMSCINRDFDHWVQLFFNPSMTPYFEWSQFAASMMNEIFSGDRYRDKDVFHATLRSWNDIIQWISGHTLNRTNLIMLYKENRMLFCRKFNFRVLGLSVSTHVLMINR